MNKSQEMEKSQIRVKEMIEKFTKAEEHKKVFFN